MERPTTLEVDLALMISKLDSPTASNAAKLLAMEVRALREELDTLRRDEMHEHNLRVDLHATVARVEAHCDEADKRGAPYAVALRAALRGAP